MRTHPLAATCATVLLLYAVLSPPPTLAQAAIAVEGRVVAAVTGGPLQDVTVRVLGTGRTAFTDAQGRFLLVRLPAGRLSLSFEMLGYQPRVLTVEVAGGTRSLAVELAAQPLAVEAIVVTAQKRQQAVQEVPVSITVYDGEFLRATGTVELDALSAYVPGLEVQIQSPNNAGFAVRGITSDEGDPRAEARVSVFQDGISISRSQSSAVELFDMQRTEVLKGPQGTLFGRAAEIGALHLIQQKPTPERSAQLSVGSGNLGHWSLTGHANAPLVADRLYGRVAGTFAYRDGYVRNRAGGTLNGKETLALRGLLRWTPAPLTDLDLIVNWQQDTPPGVAFLSGTFAPGPGVPASARDEGFLAGDDRFPGLAIDRSIWGATLLADHGLGSTWTLQAVAGYRTFDSDEEFDADGTASPALNFAEDAEGTQGSLELRALFAARRMSGSLGMSGFWQEGSQRVPFRTDPRCFFPLLTRVLNVQSEGEFPEIPLLVEGQSVCVATLPREIVFLAEYLAPGDALRQEALRELLRSYAGQPLAAFHEETYVNDARNTAFDAFADGTFALTDRLHLTAGLRVSHEKLRSGYRVEPSATPSPLGLFTGAAPNILFAPTPSGRRIARAESFTALVGRVAADLEAREGLHVFASWGRGRRPPVIQQVDSATRLEVLRAETVDSYEIGAKGLVLDDRLQYDVAAYYYDYDDFQTNVQPRLEGSISFRSDQGEATGYGGEVSLQLAVGGHLSIFGNYAYLHAQFDDTGTGDDIQALAGNTFRLAPKHSLSAGFGYTASLGRVGQLFVRPSYTWKSRVYFEEEQQGATVENGLAPGLYQQEYGLLNARAGLTIDRGRMEVELWGANLLDAEYLLDAGNTGLAFWVPTYIPGPPRLFGVKVTARR